MQGVGSIYFLGLPERTGIKSDVGTPFFSTKCYHGNLDYGRAWVYVKELFPTSAFQDFKINQFNFRLLV